MSSTMPPLKQRRLLLQRFLRELGRRHANVLNMSDTITFRAFGVVHGPRVP